MAHAYNSRGIVYDLLGDYERSISDYNASIALDPNEPSTFNNRGYAYKLKGDIDRALPDYDKAIALDPRCAIAYINRGIAYYRKDQYDVAIEDFTRAIENEAPAAKLAVAYINRGHCWFMKRETERALADYSRSIALDPADAGAYAQRAMPLRRQGGLCARDRRLQPRHRDRAATAGALCEPRRDLSAQDQADPRRRRFLSRVQAAVGT